MNGYRFAAFAVEAEHRAKCRAERKEIAVRVMSAIVNGHIISHVAIESEAVARKAVALADALIKELNKDREE